MTLGPKGNSATSLHSCETPHDTSISRHSAFRSYSHSLPVWQSFSLTDLVIDDLNRKLKGCFTEDELTQFNTRLVLYFSLERDMQAHEALAKDLELKLVKLEYEARQAELKLHTTEALFSWAGLKWVETWPDSDNTNQEHLYYRITENKQLEFWSPNMAEPITTEVAGGIRVEQERLYQSSQSDSVLLDALQQVRKRHIETIVLERAQVEALIDAEIQKIVHSFMETTDVHAAATPSAVRLKRSEDLRNRLHKSRQELLMHLLEMEPDSRLAYLSKLESVTLEIDAKRVEQAMRYGNHEATVSDTQQALVRSPQMARCPEGELEQAKQRLAKQSIDLKRLDDGQTILDKAIALKNADLIERILAYAGHLDSALTAQADSDIELVSLFAEVAYQEGRQESRTKPDLLVHLTINTEPSRAASPMLAPLANPEPVKPWLIAYALQGEEVGSALRSLAQHGCLFDRVLMKKVLEIATLLKESPPHTPIHGEDDMSTKAVTPAWTPMSATRSVPNNSDSSTTSEAISLPPIPISDLLDEEGRVKVEHLAILLASVKEGLSQAFIADLMLRYQQPNGWPKEIWEAIQERYAYLQREKEHFEILTQHCHKSLNYLTQQYLKHSEGHNRDWYEKKLKAELTGLHEAYRGQIHTAQGVDIREALMKDPCLSARKNCKPSKTISLLPRSSPATVSEISDLEQPSTASDVRELLDKLKLSVEERQAQAKKYYIAKHVFKKTLQYLDRTSVHNGTKKEALLTLCDRFAKGELENADALMRQLETPDSPSGKILWARRDQLEKPAKSYGLLVKDLNKRGDLVRNVKALVQPIAKVV